MKLKDVLNGGEKELEDIKIFNYVQGSISRLDGDESPEEAQERVKEASEKGLCLRCEKPLEEGREFCMNCGAKKIQKSE